MNTTTLPTTLSGPAYIALENLIAGNRQSAIGNPPSPPSLLRAPIATGLDTTAGLESAIDLDNGIIRGIAVMTTGEAKGHGIKIDGVSVDQVTALGQAADDKGIKSRFGHPNMSSTALGTFLGRQKNFRLTRNGDKETVRADLHIADSAHRTPNGDLAAYVLELAVEDPDAFGNSNVIKTDRHYPAKADGTPHTIQTHRGPIELLPIALDRNGDPILDDDDPTPYARIVALRASDIVDDPAANDGLYNSAAGYGFFTDSVKLSAEATAVLDKVIQSEHFNEIAANFLQRYLENHSPLTTHHSPLVDSPQIHATIQSDETHTTHHSPLTTHQEPSMLTLAQLRDQQPELVQAIELQAVEAAKATIVAQELARCKAIAELGHNMGTMDAALEAIANGTPTEAATAHLLKSRNELEALEAPANIGAGTATGIAQAPDDPPATEKPTEPQTFEDAWSAIEKERSCSRAQAARIAARRHPKLYEEYVLRQPVLRQ